MLNSIEELQQQQEQQYELLDSSIQGNITETIQQTDIKVNELDWKIFNNASQIYSTLAAQITLKDQQIQTLTQQLQYISSIVLYTNEQELWFQCQQHLYTFKTFDTPTVTDTIQSSNFSSGFVFGQTNIQNAFVDIQSIGTQFTLFKLQNVFYNIKIQLSDSVFGTGAILSPNQQLIINQMSFVSGIGKDFTVNSGSVLSILQQTTISANITNLLLNITMNSASAGSFNLFSFVNGKLFIKGYLINGIYSSQNSLTFGVNNVYNSQIYMLNIYVNPQSIQVGNYSSYILSFVNSSETQMKHISINIGNISQSNLLSSISTSLTNYLIFGGLICNQNSSSTTIYDINFIIYDKISTLFINNSGKLIGISANDQISIFSICISLTLICSETSQFNKFGMIGSINSTLIINQLTSTQSYQSGIQHQTGSIIGYANGISSNYMNIKLQIFFDNNQGSYTGALAGSLQAQIQLIQNITIEQSIITGTIQTGIITSTLRKLVLSQLSICSSTVFTYTGFNSFSGSIAGQTSDVVTLQQCFIYNLSIVSKSLNYSWAISGGLIGDTHEFTTNVQQVKIISTAIKAFGSTSGVISSSGLIAFQYSSTITISDVQVQDTNVSAYNNNFSIYSAGFLSAVANNTVSITNSQLTTVRINGSGTSSYLGVAVTILGSSTFSFQNVTTTGTNQINGATIANCPNVIAPSQNGC
ncbi:Hypothetical_protein [Hexamita inflata]|uniref:Hypothetical_protein n=1 Tax=Hexamita inflata TaxID=28002 RepID=A0AA86QRB3_9EUKA|nr:Hypothetical protein HINF_LOCUS46807 [Hexamita inflata]